MREEYRNPLVLNRADPWCIYHSDGYYYFTGSYPAYDRIEIRRAKTLNALYDAPSKVVWGKHETGLMSWHIWAPELHYIDGVWYLYFTAGEKENIWNIRPFVLVCKDENPMDGTWEERGRIDVGHESFSLDMTTFENKGQRYFIWAQKKETDEFGSCLYMAKAKNPWSIEGEPIRLTKPEYDWEKQGFDVNEGPAVLIRNGKVIVTFSASDTGYRYCMGMIWAEDTADLMDIHSWTKEAEPVFQTSFQNKQFGPGHNCFTVDDGKDVLIYHCRNYQFIEGDPLQDPNRHARAKVFSYNEQGLPVFGEPTAEK